MPEIKEVTKKTVITYKCDNCNNGYMFKTGKVYSKKVSNHTRELKAVHRCDNCDIRADFNETYPATKISPTKIKCSKQ